MQGKSVACFKYLSILSVVADYTTELVVSFHNNAVHTRILRMNVYDRVALTTLDVQWKLRVCTVRHNYVDTAPVARFMHKSNNRIVVR